MVRLTPDTTSVVNMPLYEYECDNGHRFEMIRKFSDPPIAVCPTCGAPVHKLISSPAFQFKGSGWYITDYAKSGSGSPANGDSSKKSDSTDGSAAKEASPAKSGSTASSAKSSDSAASSTTSKPVSDKK
jgi:putative FmdB family regulatory protein